MRRTVLLLALLGLALARPAAAWHNGGHMAVARIAWQQLDPAQQKRAVLILQHLPFKDSFFAGRPEGVPATVWMFTKAATWPDWVRDPFGPDLTPEDRHEIKRKYNRPDWHFINLPFVYPDEAGQFDDAALRKKALQPELDQHGQPRHALAALKRAVSQLEDPQTSDEDRAVALCWVLHLTGDLHQPLHATALIAAKLGFDPPHGDKGGNRCAIRVNPADEDALELHTYWDALQFSSHPKFPEVEAKALAWLKEPGLQRDQFTELGQAGSLAWADEDLELAKTRAYRDGDALLGFKALPPKHTPTDLQHLDAPVLSDAYKAGAAEVAKRRMTLAGYRLGDQLKSSLKPAP
jgi:S1/P1 Nuclease